MASRIILLVFLCASAYKYVLSDKCTQEGSLEYSSALSEERSEDFDNGHCKSVYQNVGRKYSELKNTIRETNKEDTEDVIIKISDEDYYAMPQMFQLDTYSGCVKRGGVFCLGNFELSPVEDSSLFRIMKRVSANWADFMNHTRIHRGVCLTRSCPPPQASSHEDWFESCVNAKMMSDYNLTARLYSLEYCQKGQPLSPPLSTNEKAFAVFIAVILVFTAIGTILDVKLSDASKRNHRWALSWSLYSSWNALVAPTRTCPEDDLRAFDGLRVWCMVFVIGAHVTIFEVLAYVSDTSFERHHHSLTNMLLLNSTLVVQVFFMMSSFLMAQKLLRDETQEAAVLTFFKTMFNRFIRLSPGYFLAVWFSMTWWVRVDEAPLWPTLVGTEKVRCQQNWWLQFTYLDNSIDLHERCLVQGWYLPVDMQFYAMSLALTLLLRKYCCSRRAIKILSVLLIAVVVSNLVIDYMWHIKPNFLVHNYQAIMHVYKGSTSMNSSYRSLLGNAGSPLVGLLLAHAHVSRTPGSVADTLLKNKVFRMCTALSLPAAWLFACASPAALGAGPPPRLRAAALAAVERPVFVALVAFGMFGAINGVDSIWRKAFSHAHAASRLTYGAYLLHLFFGLASAATKHTYTHYDFKTIFTESFGILVWAYSASFLLAMLVEFPTQTLYREIKKIVAKLSKQK